MQTIDTIFASEPTDRAFRVKFNDVQVFVIDSVQRGQDRGEPPHAVANVVEMVNGSKLFAEGPGGPALFFYLSEVAEVRDASSDAVVFVAS